MDHPFTADERRLIELWERPHELRVRGARRGRDGRHHVGDNYVNHVPTMTRRPGPRGVAGVLRAALHPQDAGRQRRSPRSAGPSARGG